MLGHRQAHYDLLALARFVEIADRMARNKALGKVVVEIANPRQPELLKRLFQLRPDAVERLRLGERRWCLAAGRPLSRHSAPRL